MPPRSRRGVAVVSSGGGGRSAAERLAALAGRLTDRDRTLCRLLHQHRVLTTPQLIDLAFPSRNAAEHRLAILHQLGVLDRFRPHHTPGSAPYHYVLGPLGAALLAAEADQEPAQLGYRRDRTLALAHSQRLAHLLGVNSFFCALARAARGQPDAALEVWWSEQRCAAQWGRLVHPDGYGRWREQQTAGGLLPGVRPGQRTARAAGRQAARLPRSSPRPARSPPRCCCGCPPQRARRPPATRLPAAACRWPPPPPTPTTPRPGRCGCRCTPAADGAGWPSSPAMVTGLVAAVARAPPPPAPPPATTRGSDAPGTGAVPARGRCHGGRAPPPSRPVGDQTPTRLPSHSRRECC